MTAETIIHALEAKRAGSAWMARCPAHDDRGPSLAIREAGGKVLLHCHAGCEQRDVIEALKARGLWEGTGAIGSAWREWRDGIRYHSDWGTPVQEYRYSDEHGQALYSVVRFEPKTFRQGYADAGRWVWKKHQHQVLYHLPEVLESAICFLVEGEKDVETLRSWGFCATTNAGGAKAPWLDEFTEALRGREVIILPDNDRPGKERALTIARALVGKAARLIVLELEGAKDISEWFAHGHREVELIALVEGQEVTQ